MNGIQFYFNAEFDFELRSGADQKVRLAAEQMAPLFSPALSPNDQIIGTAAPEESYYEYLQTLELSYARVVSPLKAHSGRRFEAWGWSDAALQTANRIGGTADAPSPEICRVVNSRSFSSYVNEKYGLGVRYSQVANNFSMVLDTISAFPDVRFVLKPFHGNSGAGFLFIEKESPQRILNQAEQLVSSEPAVLEEWVERICDLASLFYVEKDGSVRIIGHHRNICSSAGAFYASMVCENDPELVPWKDRLEAAVHAAAQEVHRAGYFGMVSADSFVYRRGETVDIACAVDINCRYSMSYIAHALFRKCRVPALLYRFIGRKRLSLPDDYRSAAVQLGDLAYSPSKRRGAALLSPLQMLCSDGEMRKPDRSAFFIAGENPDDLLRQDEILRERVRRSAPQLSGMSEPGPSI